MEIAAESPLFAALSEFKSQRKPTRDLDYLRALFFDRKGNPYAAIEAAKEELRFFPDHAEAAALVAKLQAAFATELPDDPEFRELHAVVRDFTMMPLARMWNLFKVARELCQADVPGNFAECGVAAGGSSAMLAAVIKRHSRRPRRLFSCDTFTGMPDPTAEDRHLGLDAQATGWGAGTCAAPVDSLRAACEQLGAWDVVEPVVGLFGDTLPPRRGEIGSLALLHADGDFYQSTLDIFTHLHDLVVPGGVVQIDDFGQWEGCQRAVEEFQRQRGVKFDLQKLDHSGVWFRREARR